MLIEVFLGRVLRMRIEIVVYLCIDDMCMYVYVYKNM